MINIFIKDGEFGREIVDAQYVPDRPVSLAERTKRKGEVRRLTDWLVDIRFRRTAPALLRMAGFAGRKKT